MERPHYNTLNITICLDNSQFTSGDYNNHEARTAELHAFTSILVGLHHNCIMFPDYITGLDTHPSLTRPISDTNGNRVGEMKMLRVDPKDELKLIMDRIEERDPDKQTILEHLKRLSGLMPCLLSVVISWGI